MSLVLFIAVVAVAVFVAMRVKRNGSDPLDSLRWVWSRLEGGDGEARPVALRVLTKALFDSLVDPRRRLSDDTIVETASRFVVLAAPGDAEDLASELDLVEIDVNKRIVSGQRKHKLRITTPIRIVDVIYDHNAAAGRPRLLSEAKALDRKTPGLSKARADQHEGRRRRSAEDVGTTPVGRDKSEARTTTVYAGVLVSRDGRFTIPVPAAGADFGRDDKFSATKTQIEDPKGTVSRIHGRIMPSPDGMTVEDLSTNGTSVNGTRLRKGRCYVLAENDELTLGGDVVLIWKPTASSVKTKLLPSTKGRR